MSSNLSPFRIDILDASGNKIAAAGGPIQDVISLSDTRSLDAIGTLEFTMPAASYKAEFIQIGVTFDIYDQVDGYLGRFIFSSKTIDDRDGQAILRVSCYDRLRELALETVGFNRNYTTGTSIATIINDVVTLVPNWSTNVTDPDSNVSLTFQGESILRAIDEVRDRQGVHYRLAYDVNNNPVLEFGPFGDLSDIQFTQLKGQVQSDYQQNPKTAFIHSASIVEESDEIWNTIIPVGSGQGVSQLTIEKSTDGVGAYDKQSEANPDSSLRWFIQDISSVNQYGKKVRIVQFPQIRPLSNSTANVRNAANALKLTSAQYLLKHRNPRREYKLTVYGLRSSLEVGDKIKVRYYQTKNGVTYIAINEEFYVMDIARIRDVGGNRSFNINIASVDARSTSDASVIIDVVRDLRDLNVHIPATLAYSPIGPYVRRIRGDASAINRVNPEFVIRIKEEVLYLNRALLRFSTSPLKSSTTGAAAGGDHVHAMFQGGTADPGGGTSFVYSSNSSLGNPHSWVPRFVTFPGGGPDAVINTFTASGDHTHAAVYDVFEDTDTPDEVGVLLNGVNITSALGGPWFVGGGAGEEEIDITDYLDGTSGGFRQQHTLTFFAQDGKGEIECEIDLLVTIQAIAV